MKLYTLGELELKGSDFRQTRALLLLAYLALEGAKTRHFIAELFWPTASNPMNSVAVAVSKLRKMELLEGDGTRIWSTSNCDAADLKQQLRSGNFDLDSYKGAFLETVKLSSFSQELEEWVYATREDLAGEARASLLTLAEQEAALGKFEQAAQLAQKACTFAGAAPLEADDLARFYTLLLAANHPFKEVLEREAKELGLPLANNIALAQSQLRRSLLGREKELSLLAGLETGQWAWVHGGAGIGKTTLIRELASKTGWRFVPARSGLPYATLEPLLDQLEGGEDTLLRRLAKQKENIILDGWEAADVESQCLLQRLRTLRPPICMVIGSREAPPFAVEQLLELGPLPAEALRNYLGAFEATQGAPVLVGAWLRGESLEMALQNRLAVLPDTVQQVYGVLTLLDKPDFGMVRKALHLDATQLAQALEALTLAGLIDPLGGVRGQASAQQYLQAHPHTEAQLALAVARHLPATEAFPLFQKARAFWQEDDLPEISEAYLAFAKETLRRGLPQQVIDLLQEAPNNEAITLLKGQALERAGHYKEALETVEALVDNPKVSALKSALYRRLGRPEDAEKAAELAVKGDMEARAEGLNTLGQLAFAKGEVVKAEALFGRSAVLWQGLGEHERWLGTLNSRAYAKAEMGEDVEEAFKDLLKASEDNLLIQARTLNNIGVIFEKKDRLEEAKAAYLASVDKAGQVGSRESLLQGWNNLGVFYHQQNQVALAKEAYEKALSYARQAGNRSGMGLALANLAELTSDISAWEEAAELLEVAGKQAMAKRVKADMARFLASTDLV